MSRLLVTSLAIALAGGSIASAQDVKMGLVDFNRMQKSFYRTEVEKKTFEDRRAEENKKAEEKINVMKELLQKQEALQKDMADPGLSDEKKRDLLKQGQERAGQINSLQREIVDMQQKVTAELAEEATRIQKSLTTEIYEVTGKVAQAKGLDIVFNRTFGLNGVPVFAYTSDDKLVDFTDDVIKELNKGAPAGWKPPVEGSEGQ